MVFPSSYIAQSVAAQNSMFSGFQAYSMQASYGAGLMGGGPTPPMPQMMPPPPAPVTLGAVARGYGGYGGGPTAGAYGEALAGRMVSMGQTGVGLAGAGLTALGAASSLGLVGGGLGTVAAMANPISMAGSAAIGAYGMAGGGMAGLAAGGLAGGAIGLPLYAGAMYASGLAKNFTGGMQDQMALNSTLRQNFNFLGGQGAYGRGFNQQQMGQIGRDVSQELRSNTFTSAGELNQVIAGGAQMGQFTGVRDVQEFSRKFKEMLTTLKTVQRELGGSLTEAMEFVNQSRQAGVFGTTSATRFAGTIRTVSAATGFDQGQLVQLASNGAQIARAVGGNGAQGAFGALRGISTVSTALQGGMISEEMLSAATGGRTGQDAMSSFVTDMMQQTARYSRTAAGRYTVFGLANREGTGLDEGSVLDFMSGDVGAGSLSRRAHQQVGRMGRAQAINREGLLRGGLLEQGGMAAQLGYMRMLVGDRALDQGDDLTSLVMQRRLHMSRPQAEIMTSLMRNQGRIASQEADDAVSSTREGALRTDVRERRSLDAFTRHFTHSIEDATGMLTARDMGRSFVTKISSSAEKVLNDLLGITSEQMTTEGQRSMSRMRQGRASRSDLEVLGFGAGGFAGGTSAFDIDSRGLLETGRGIGEQLRVRGVSTSGITRAQATEQIQRVQAAEMGVVSGTSDLIGLNRLQADTAGSTRQIVMARLAAEGTGNADDLYRFANGANANATAAFMSRQGIRNEARIGGIGQLMGRGTSGRIDFGMAARDLGRVAAGAMAGSGGGPIGALIGAGIGLSRSEMLEATRSPDEGALGFIASGGHFARGVDALEESHPELQGLPSTAREAGMRDAMRRVSTEDLAGLRGNADFMRHMRRVAGASGTARDEAMQNLTTYIGGQEAGASRTAMASVLTQMTENISRRGGIGAEMRTLMEDPAARRAAQERVREHGISLRAMGTAGGGAIGEATSELGAAALAGDSDRYLEAQTAQRTAVLGATDEEYRGYASRLMDMSQVAPQDRDQIRAERRAALLTSSHQRAIDRDLRSEGRRGRQGAYETAVGEMTGYSTGRLDFELQGRHIGGRGAQSVLQRALSGANFRGRDEVLTQFRAQMEDQEGLGLNAQQAKEMQNVLTGAMSRRGRDGAFTEADRTAMSAFTGREDIQEAMRQATVRRTEQALSSASSRDPVGAETNRLLGTIQQTLAQRLPGSESSGPNMSNPDGTVQ